MNDEKRKYYQVIIHDLPELEAYFVFNTDDKKEADKLADKLGFALRKHDDFLVDVISEEHMQEVHGD